MGMLIDFGKAMYLSGKASRLKRKSDRLASKIGALHSDNPLRMQIIGERESIEMQRHLIDSKVRTIHEAIDQAGKNHLEQQAQRAENPDRYVRPEGFMNEKLGSLPVDAKVLTPSPQEMREVESHGLLLLVVSVGFAIGIFAASAAFPWLARGITGLWSTSDTTYDASQFGFAHVIAVVYVLLMTVFKKWFDKKLYVAMIAKEQRFRMGSEKWTWSQRGSSYLANMLTSVFHLLFFPIVVIFFFWLPIPILSKLYLDTQARTGDAEYATLTAAKFHTRLLQSMLLALMIIVLLPWISSFFQ